MTTLVWTEEGSELGQATKGKTRGLDHLPEGQLTSPLLNSSLEQVLMQVRDNLALRWPNKLKSDPNKHLRNKYCSFHRDHEHNTSECYDLK